MENSTRFPHLSDTPVLAGLAKQSYTAFLNECSVHNFLPGEHILTQGAPSPGMYILAQGTVEITSLNDEGQRVLIHMANPLDVFGDTECLADMPSAASCIATGQAIVLLADSHQISRAVQSNIFQRNLFRMSYERLDRDNKYKFVDQFYPVEQRLAEYLHRLSVGTADIPKTQADLAGLLGCARQTLNRELRGLKARNIIELQKGKIVVLDRDSLKIAAQPPRPDTLADD